VPTFVLAQEIQAPLRRLALRRQHVERVERVQTIQAAVRRAQWARSQTRATQKIASGRLFLMHLFSMRIHAGA